MAINADYLEYLKEPLEWLPQLRIKRMFGGAGFHSGELSIAIATDTALNPKGGAEYEPFCNQGGAEPFTYEVKGKTTRLNFWLLPVDVMEHPHELQRWSRMGLDTALRARK